MMYRWTRVTGIMAAMVVIGCGGSEPGTTNSDEQKPRVAYVTNGIADFWSIADAGAKKGAEEFGADVQVLMPANGIGDQKQQIEDLISQGIDGLAVSPIDPVNQTELLNEVAENTILITMIQMRPNPTDRYILEWIIIWLAECAVNWLKRRCPKGAK